jgi:hypothetical protein
MPTSFSEIRGYIRTVVGDINPVVPMYSNDILDAQIRFVILTINSTDIQEGLEGYFTDDLTPAEKAKVTIRVALGLIAPRESEFSYKTPVLSVTRKGGTSRLYQYLMDLLLNIDTGGNRFSISSETDLEAMLNGANRFLNEYTDAVSSLE